MFDQAAISSSHDDVDSDGFLPATELAVLARAGAVSVEGALLHGSDGRRYLLIDAVRVLGVVTRDTDPFGLIGSIVPLRQLLASGFAVTAGQMALGRVAYAVEQGVVCQALDAR